jgi:hypothetical protein
VHGSTAPPLRLAGDPRQDDACPPLRLAPITKRHHYYGRLRPYASASVLSALRVCRLGLSLNIVG